jgi:hypothetical protein
MPLINSLQSGKIVVDGKTYTRDILILTDGTVKYRDDVFLDFVNHIVKQAEINELLKGYPEIIVIGTGTDEKLRLSFHLERLITDMKADLIALATPKAVEKYNRLAENNNKIAALFHITD